MEKGSGKTETDTEMHPAAHIGYSRQTGHLAARTRCIWRHIQQHLMHLRVTNKLWDAFGTFEKATCLELVTSFDLFHLQ
jgi:hypothetical protein